MPTESPAKIEAGADRFSREIEFYYAGESRCEAGHAWGPLGRDHYVLHLIVSGRGIFGVNGREERLGAFDCFLIRPGVKTCYRADDTDPWHYRWVGFNGLLAEKLVAAGGFPPTVRTASGEAHFDELQACFQQLAEACRRPEPARELGGNGAIYLIFSLLARCNSDGTAPVRESDGDRKAWYVRRVMNFIERNYVSAELSVEDLARRAGINRSHLARIFRQTINLSPTAYLASYRIRKACELLESRPDLRIKEIACSVGYRDPLFFSKEFRKLKGIPPQEFRKRNG